MGDIKITKKQVLRDVKNDMCTYKTYLVHFNIFNNLKTRYRKGKFVYTIEHNELFEYEKFIENIQLLIKKARENNVEVIYILHDEGAGSELASGNVGFEVIDEFKPMAEEKKFVKTVNSAFKETGLVEYLVQKNEKDECDYILKLMEQKRKIPDKAELNKTQSTIEYELGFQSKRNDFDYKYDDQAELAISDLTFSDEMTQEEINNNYKLLEQYNKLLDKREILEQFVIEWEFLNKESIDSNYINTMLNKYKFMLDKETFTQLVNCIKERISIAHKINQLKNN